MEQLQRIRHLPLLYLRLLRYSLVDVILKTYQEGMSANDLNKLSAPLRSRFRRLHLPKYSREQFLQIAVKVCPKLLEETALIIAEETWKQQGDIRDVISLSKLVKKHDGPGEIAEIIKTLAKYGEPRMVRGSGIGHGSRDRSSGWFSS
jgi:hypothetical protein